ncbi:MAG: hypothetical protein K0Q46_6644 [Rhodococcus erythropolis]|nr:hypothetical protein [Rhodococcus erythropolis]RAL31340.1 hypothetical protein CVN56_28405 [Rhodococcus sp. AQ5-07]
MDFPASGRSCEQNIRSTQLRYDGINDQFHDHFGDTLPEAAKPTSTNCSHSTLSPKDAAS